MSRDSQRARVYAAEDVWRAQLDAARAGAREATVGGSRVVLPLELIFGGLDAVRAWLERLEADPGYAGAADIATSAAPVPLAVRARRGGTKAHYEPPGTIALPAPEHGAAWALRETVVLHEVAHHVAGPPLTHGQHFTATLLRLARLTLGPEAAFVLGVHYATAGVSVAWGRVAP